MSSCSAALVARSVRYVPAGQVVQSDALVLLA
jgi:hypothetical protein